VRVSLCLIVWNELEGCRQQVPRLPRDAFDEIYAVDGGSNDGTVEYLTSQGITVHRQPRPGLNAAYVHANRVSTCDAVVAFLPKGTTPVEDLKRFRPLFEAGNELVVASRQIAGATNEEDAGIWRPRKWAVRCLAMTAALLWRRDGYWVRDVLHGFKGWTRPAFERMEILDRGLSIDLEMVIRAYRLRIRRAEFATTETRRSYGESHFKIWPTGKKLAAYLWFELRRGGEPAASGERGPKGAR
jgi:glycosyltransferase involved in cell wall biosynthesis